MASADPCEDHGSSRRFIGLDVETISEFRELDKNDDREIDRAEFYFSSISQLAIQSGGRDKAGKVFEAIDSDGSLSISLREMAESQHTRNMRILPHNPAKDYFDLDSNNNGLVEKDECPTEGGLDFVAADSNQSGVLSPFEFLHSKEDQDQSVAPGFAAEFIRLDANDDGVISRDEYTKKQSDRKFSRCDPNGNDQILPAEYAKLYKLRVIDGMDETSARFFSMLDRNKNGSISRREYSRSPFARFSRDEKKVDDLFKKIDIDGDGELNPREYAARMVNGGFTRGGSKPSEEKE